MDPPASLALCLTGPTFLGHAAPLAVLVLFAATGPSLDSALSPLATLLLLPALLLYHRGLARPLLLLRHYTPHASSPRSRLLRTLLAWPALALGHYFGYAGGFQTPNDQGQLVNSLHPAARLLLGLFAALPYVAALIVDTVVPTIVARRRTGLALLCLRPAHWSIHHKLLQILSHLATRTSWLAFPATLTTANFFISRNLSPFGTWGTLTDGIPTSDASTAILNLLGLHGLVFLIAVFSNLVASSQSHRLCGAHTHPSPASLDCRGFLDGTHSASPYTLAAASDPLVSSPPMSDLDLHSHAHGSAAQPPPPPPLGRLVSRRISSSMFAESGIPSVPATPVRATTAATGTSSTNATSGSFSRPTSAKVAVQFLPAMRRWFGVNQVPPAAQPAPAPAPAPVIVDAAAIPPPHTRSRTSDSSATSLTAAIHLTSPPAACPCQPAATLSTTLARLLFTLVVLATYTSLLIRHPHAPLSTPSSSSAPNTPRLMHLGCIVNHQSPARDVWKSTQVLANSASSARNATGAPGPHVIVWSEEATRVASGYERDALVEHAKKVARAHDVWLALAYWEPAGLPSLMPTGDGKEEEEQVRAGSKWVGKNKVTLVNPGGDVVLDYVKVHPVFDVEGDIQPGRARMPPVVDVEGVKVAMAICLDGDFDGWIQRAASGADVLIMPSWTWGSLGATHRLHAQHLAASTGLTVIRCPSWGTMSVDLPTGDAVYAQRMEGVGMSPMVPVPVVKVVTMNTLVPDWLAWACVAWCVLQVVAVAAGAGSATPHGEAEGMRARGDVGEEEEDQVGEEAPLLRHVTVVDHGHAAVAIRRDMGGVGAHVSQPLPYPSDFFASWGDDAGNNAKPGGSAHEHQEQPARIP